MLCSPDWDLDVNSLPLHDLIWLQGTDLNEACQCRLESLLWTRTNSCLTFSRIWLQFPLLFPQQFKSVVASSLLSMDSFILWSWTQAFLGYWNYWHFGPTNLCKLSYHSSRWEYCFVKFLQRDISNKPSGNSSEYGTVLTKSLGFNLYSKVKMDFEKQCWGKTIHNAYNDSL